MKRKQETLGANIKYLMELNDVPQFEVARAIGVGKNTMISRFKQPETFTIGELNRLAAFFHVDRTVLLEGKLS